MIADGIEGSAAAVIRIGSVNVCVMIRLAAADRALSSGRAEWAGLLLVKAILRRVRANVTLRLGNLQVAKSSTTVRNVLRTTEPGNWLRQNERDMASLAWELAANRERRGFGSTSKPSACGPAPPAVDGGRRGKRRRFDLPVV